MALLGQMLLGFRRSRDKDSSFVLVPPVVNVGAFFSHLFVAMTGGRDPTPSNKPFQVLLVPAFEQTAMAGKEVIVIGNAGFQSVHG